MRIRAAVLAAMLGLTSFAAPAVAAPHKLALLIGNKAYSSPATTGWNPLPNAVNDVGLVAEALGNIGFDVTMVADGKWSDIEKGVKLFSEKISDEDIVVFYYAGHGFEFNRRNYLVPIDAPGDVDTRTLPARFIDFEQIANLLSGGRASVFVLDACRTAGPVVRTSPVSQPETDVQTLADFDFAPGTNYAVLFSTARGVVARDEAGPPPGYSPFAWEFAKYIGVPNIRLMTTFDAITQGVYERTKAFVPAQSPSFYGSLLSAVYFNQAASPTRSAAAATMLAISDHDLATFDEPVLIARVLSRYAVADLRELATQGDGQATYLLGYMYEFGIGVPKDLAAARSWLESAATLGSPSGILELAYFLHHHPAQPTDRQRAVDLYRRAAETGFAKAQGHYGSLLIAGTLVPRSSANRQAGLYMLRSSARSGYPYAAFALAEQGQPEERPEWRAHLAGLAAAGEPEGYHWLCQLDVDSKAYGDAINHCRTAAELGYGDSQAQLALAYSGGKGVAPSVDEAMRWARRGLSHADLDPAFRAQLLSIQSAYREASSQR